MIARVEITLHQTPRSTLCHLICYEADPHPVVPETLGKVSRVRKYKWKALHEDWTPNLSELLREVFKELER
jgi:hypothetical protein